MVSEISDLGVICLIRTTSYVATYGADPLASFHLKRLLAGEVGSTIRLDAE